MPFLFLRVWNHLYYLKKKNNDSFTGGLFNLLTSLFFPHSWYHEFTLCRDSASKFVGDIIFGLFVCLTRIGSANHGPKFQQILLHVFVNKALLEYSHTCVITYNL